MRTILIASPKGGCGKTTVATNLAAFYATAGKETVLIDCDRQGSSLHWAEKRAALAHPVLGMAGKPGSKVTVKVPSGTKRCIVDTAAGIRVAEVAELLDAADALLIPVMPSVIDLEASEAFFAELAELPALKRKKFPVAKTGVLTFDACFPDSVVGFTSENRSGPYRRRAAGPSPASRSG